MKYLWVFTFFTFLLIFISGISAQTDSPNIVWKDMQEKYERFEDVKPTIVNKGEPAVSMFSDVKLGIIHDFIQLYRLDKDFRTWYAMPRHGHPANKKYQARIMSNYRIEGLQERSLIFDDEDWSFLTESDGLWPYVFRDDPIHKGKGKYKFKLQFYAGDKKSKKLSVSESPVFEIFKDQIKSFDR